MMQYKVSWHITIKDAENVLDAAEQANDLRRNDPENEHSYLRVAAPGGKFYRVDTSNGTVFPITREDAERIG